MLLRVQTVVCVLLRMRWNTKGAVYVAGPQINAETYVCLLLILISYVVNLVSFAVNLNLIIRISANMSFMYIYQLGTRRMHSIVGRAS